MTPAERKQLEYLANQLIMVARGPDLSEYNVEMLAMEIRALYQVAPTEAFITEEDRAKYARLLFAAQAMRRAQRDYLAHRDSHQHGGAGDERYARIAREKTTEMDRVLESFGIMS